MKTVGDKLKKYEGTQEHVIIPEGIRVIEDYAFSGAREMRTVFLPQSLQEIGNSAFYHCENLEEIVIPSSVYFVGEGLFSRCAKLKKAVLPAGLTVLPKITFYQCESLSEVTLPEQLRKIGRGCFEQCRSLKKILFPDTLREIDDNAFDDCTSLKKVYLPEQIEVLGNNVFFSCRGLRYINLPSSLKHIGKGALETRGRLQIDADESVYVSSAMLDNNWNMNWNFGSNGRYNGKNEENYQLVNSFLLNVDLREWKPQAKCILALNYLESYRKDVPFYTEWIRSNADECLQTAVSLKRYDALYTAVKEGILTPDQAEPYLGMIRDPSWKAKVMELGRNNHTDLDDLWNML